MTSRRALLDDIGLPGNFLVRANGQSPVDTDYYSVAVQAGDTLTITTATPAGGMNQFVNTLDPYIELYDPAGNRVAWDDNSAPDSRNAQITYSATQSGNYVVRVLGAQGSAGEYVLKVTGPRVRCRRSRRSTRFQAMGSGSPLSPSTFTVHFNDSLQLTSVQGSDLLVDGVAASNVTITDATTAVFTLPAFAEGSHQVTIDAGAILDRQGTPIQAFTSTFIIDQTGPRIAASSIHEGDTIPVGNLTYTAVFNEDMDATVLDPTDFSLVGTAERDLYAATASPGPIRTPSNCSSADLRDDTYTLTLLSGAGQFQDLVGNILDGEPHTPFSLPSGNGHSGGNFFVHFTADAAVAPFPDAACRQEPAGQPDLRRIDAGGHRRDERYG